MDSDKCDSFEQSLRIDSVCLKECYLPYQRMFLRNNGDVLPCYSVYGCEIPVGNIYENSIYEIWNSNKMKQLRQEVNGPAEVEPLACKKCRRSLEYQTSD